MIAVELSCLRLLAAAPSGDAEDDHVRPEELLDFLLDLSSVRPVDRPLLCDLGEPLATEMERALEGRVFLAVGWRRQRDRLVRIVVVLHDARD